MSLRAVLLSTVLPLLLIAKPIAAQHGAYFGVAVGNARLKSPAPHFGASSSPVLTALVGYAWRSNLSADARISRLGDTVREARTPGPPPIARYTLGVRATILEANAGWRPGTLRIGFVQPLVTVGVLLASIVDTWESDTPEDRSRATVPGVSAAAGLDAVLGRHLALTARASYRELSRSEKRPPRNIGLRGPMWDMGFRVVP